MDTFPPCRSLFRRLSAGRRAAACALLALAVLVPRPARAGLDALVDGAAFFESSPATIERVADLQGEWQDAPDSRTVRFIRPVYRGERIPEAFFRFAPDGTPLRGQLIVYSRGDDGPSDGRDFLDRVQPLGAHLDELAGVPGVRRDVPARVRLIELRSWEWTAPRAVYRLDVASEGAGSKLRGEFIRLWLLPPPAAAPSRTAAPAGSTAAAGRLPVPASRGGPSAPPPAAFAASSRRDTAKRADLAANVVRNGNAVTIANIPMVDQGNKGYCAAATLARLLSYYGLATIDQHELAVAMDSDAKEGTSALARKKAMAEYGRQFGLRLDEIDELDFRDWEHLVKAYNSAARHRGVPTIENRGGAAVTGDAFWALADGPTLREARSETPQKQRRWLREAAKYIDEGIPVVWSVQCGILPEAGFDGGTRGGHLRLIVGYDEAAGLVYFSDTWGAGHECKAMPLGNAMAISVGRFALVPKR